MQLTLDECNAVLSNLLGVDSATGPFAAADTEECNPYWDEGCDAHFLAQLPHLAHPHNDEHHDKRTSGSM
jgi:hypothetical protein